MKFLYLLVIIRTLVIYTSLGHAQVTYIADPEAACGGNSNTAICGGYSCNGPKSCKTYLTFRSQYPYNTLSAIASLLSVDPNDIARANPNCNTDFVEWNKLVYVPITCSCYRSLYYFKFTTRIVGQNDDTFLIANNTYQGLTTREAIIRANNLDPSNFVAGKSITIPLKCACPTNNQQSKGITSLFSYVVGQGDTISSISTQLNVNSKNIREANQLPENSNIYPFTILLIPLMNGQSTSEIAVDKTPSTTISTELKFKYGGIGAASGIAFSIGGYAVFEFTFRGKFRFVGSSKCHCHSHI